MPSYAIWIYIALQMVLVIYLFRILVRVAPLALFGRDVLPFVPTSPKVLRLIKKSGLLDNRNNIVDLGCGTGTLLVLAHSQSPKAKIKGVEIRPVLARLARFRFMWMSLYRPSYKKNRPQVRQGDMYEQDISEADVIMGFWVPEVMPRLIEKIVKEAQSGCVVMSVLFPFPKKLQSTVDQHFTTEVIQSGKHDPVFVYTKK